MNSKKIKTALANTGSYPAILRRLRALDDRELGEAERVERLGQRRVNLLKALRSERYRRRGRFRGMSRLKMEARI